MKQVVNENRPHLRMLLVALLFSLVSLFIWADGSGSSSSGTSNPVVQEPTEPSLINTSR